MSSFSFASFDNQADNFEQRAGLPWETCREIAQGVLTLAQIKPQDWLLEIGAGTGQIGRWFIEQSVQYIGLDLSQKMLDKFHETLDVQQNSWHLIQSDGNQTWPVESQSVRVIFCSRTIHHLDGENFIKESYRVAHPEKSLLLIGGVQRSPDSVKDQMKKQLHCLLEKYGFQGRQKMQKESHLLALYTQRGAKAIAPFVAGSWQTVTTPQESLNNWQTKTDLAGVTLPESLKTQILSELKQWAMINFGDIEQPRVSQEAYGLRGVYLYGGV